MDHDAAMADKLARMQHQLALYLGQTKRFSYADKRVMSLIEEMAEIRDLFEKEASK